MKNLLVVPLLLAALGQNGDVYTKEGHKIEYVELAGLGHVWAVKENISEKIWKFFTDNPLP